MTETSVSFVIREHTFDGQHIRQYPQALAVNQEDVVKLHARSYTPREIENDTCKGDMTVIFYHANAIPKECYEPFFQSLYHQLKTNANLTIGSIWTADSASQGFSASLNDSVMGNDFHWWDHSRDILLMVHTFRKHMKRPIVAIGHSMGGAQASMTAHFHPRLFEALIMIDPPMTMTFAPSIPAIVQSVINKPQSFTSTDRVWEFVKKNPFFKRWDLSAVEQYIKYAWHDSPTTLQPDRKLKPRTTVHAELRGILRPNFAHVIPDEESENSQRHKFPDVSEDSPLVGPFYIPQTREAYVNLQTLRPKTLFLLAKGSQIVPPTELEHRSNYTGTGVGGNGGIAAGNVCSVTIERGHFAPLTNVAGTAGTCAEWIEQWMKEYRNIEGALAAEVERKGIRERQSLPEEAQKLLKDWDGKPWQNPQAKPDGGRSKL